MDLYFLRWNRLVKKKRVLGFSIKVSRLLTGMSASGPVALFAEIVSSVLVVLYSSLRKKFSGKALKPLGSH